MKGLTPIIAIVLLLMIVISLGGGVYFIFIKIHKSIEEEGKKQVNATTGRMFTKLKIDAFDPETGDVYIRNIGSETVSKDEITIYIDDQPVNVIYSEDIPPDKVKRFVVNISQITLAGGQHVIKVGSRSGISSELLFEYESAEVLWYFEELNYRRNITIFNAAGNLTDYQALITLNSTNFNFSHVQNDGSDIRFTYYNASSDIEEKIPYWIEYWNSTIPEARVWVKIPYLPDGTTTTIYMYYGNNTIGSESNGTATFEFFDDMENWNGWIKYGSGRVSQDSSRFYDGTFSAHKTTANDPNGAYKNIGKILGRGIVLEFWVNRNKFYTGGSADRVGLIDDSGNGYGWIFSHSKDYIGIDKRTGYSATILHSYSTTDKKDYWVFARLIITSSGIIAERYIDGSLLGSTTASDSSYSSFTRVYIFGGYDYWVDQIKIRKYASPEPTVTIGSEESKA